MFSIAVLPYSGHGGQPEIVLLTMLFIAITKYKELLNFTLHKEEKLFVYLALVS
jgi:hypothetical protein